LKNTSLSCGRRHITCRKVENLIKAWGIYAIEASTSTSTIGLYAILYQGIFIFE
jgi:hypothetical protein